MSRLDAAQRMGVICCAIAASIALAAAAAPAQSAGDAARRQARAEACGQCHGSPERPPLDGMPYLAGQSAQYLELQLILMREGLRDVPQMAPFLKGLTDRDIRDMAAHFARQAFSPNTAKRNPALYARGAELAQAMICGNCHGEDFRGQKHLPRLAGQREDYLAASLKAYRNNTRTGIDTSMNDMMYRVPTATSRRSPTFWRISNSGNGRSLHPQLAFLTLIQPFLHPFPALLLTDVFGVIHHNVHRLVSEQGCCQLA
jgi:cytochrome c553